MESKPRLTFSRETLDMHSPHCQEAETGIDILNLGQSRKETRLIGLSRNTATEVNAWHSFPTDTSPTEGRSGPNLEIEITLSLSSISVGC